MTSREEQEAIQKLRRILLGKTGERLEDFEKELLDLRNRVVDEESLISSLDPVIADLLERKISSSKTDMAEALAPIMGEAIKRQVHETKDDVVDALYPVIGQTIRRSLASSMHDFVDSVNGKIERAFIRKILPRRLQAKLMGLTPAEMMMRQSMPFKVNEIFLIHKETGLLIAHESYDESAGTVDQELVGGMLTAIRDFVNDAFSEDSDQELSEIEYGDKKICLEMGRYFYIAAVFTGIEPNTFEESLQKLARRIHNRFFRELREFDGEIAELSAIDHELRRFINDYKFSAQYKKRRQPKPYLGYFAGAAVILAVALISILTLPEYFKNRELGKKIDSYLQSSFAAEDLDDLNYTIKDEKLILSGTIGSYQTFSRLDSILHSIYGIDDIENKLKIMVGNQPVEQITKDINDRMRPFENDPFFKPKFIINGDQVLVGGFLPSAQMKRKVGYLLSEIPGVRVINNNALLLNKTQLANARSYLYEHTIFYDSDSTFIPSDQLTKLKNVGSFFKEIAWDQLKLAVRGFSDEKSNYYGNLRLSKQRAENVAQVLKKYDISDNSIVVLYYGQKYPLVTDQLVEKNTIKNSRVEFDLILGDQFVATDQNYQ